MPDAGGIVVMGVAGAGKSQLARALCAATGATFIEGDELHPPANVAKMAAGIPLDDDDRAGWLASVGERLASELANGRRAVAACSALKHRYRDRLRADVPSLSFVYLRLEPDTAAARVSGRPGHFMPVALVQSQFAALEPPDHEDGVFIADATLPPETLLTEVLAWWRPVLDDTPRADRPR